MHLAQDKKPGEALPVEIGAHFLKCMPYICRQINIVPFLFFLTKERRVPL